MLTSKMKESLSCLNATLMRPLPLCVFSLEQKGAKFELCTHFHDIWGVYMGVWVVSPPVNIKPPRPNFQRRTHFRSQNARVSPALQAGDHGQKHAFEMSPNGAANDAWLFGKCAFDLGTCLPNSARRPDLRPMHACTHDRCRHQTLDASSIHVHDVNVTKQNHAGIQCNGHDPCR